MSLFSCVKKEALDLLFPITCLGCGREGKFLCASCRQNTHFLPPSCFGCGRAAPAAKRIPAGRTCKSCRKNTPIFAFISPLSFRDELVKELIHVFKYRGLKKLAPILAEFLSDYLRYYKFRAPGSLLVPIPLRPSRKRKRGFNQAELIAKELSDIFDVLVISDILVKTKNTKPQIELGAEERRLNPLGSFKIRRPEKVAGKAIVLVDDVKTTGATLEEAARVLKEAGARRIVALTIAH